MLKTQAHITCYNIYLSLLPRSTSIADSKVEQKGADNSANGGVKKKSDIFVHMKPMILSSVFPQAWFCEVIYSIYFTFITHLSQIHHRCKQGTVGGGRRWYTLRSHSLHYLD